ncbi:DNA repair protein RecO [Desulfuromonas sp. AOP6]|uniref:DNA repair protein RecO n=1 Tax=Desulfuromonas sp. AOP6 TaxID=1566351 RepID=UPI001275DB4B|nr:DNA repair protein RecO [Desulfuromonas sp. AOP6]BCA78892.1 DNA repair protein RecO [Desulfuromonas sp. AOP6]
MQILRSEAIILRHVDYGEADRIVTFYTPELGLLKGFARSARRSRKRFGPALEPFAQVMMHWSPPGRGQLLSLKEAELLDLHAGLRTDLLALALAGYGCELVEELQGEESGHPRVYGLLRAFLGHLATSGGSPEARLLFELRLLELAGYIPHLLHCSECMETLRTETVYFEAARGGSLCALCEGGRGSLKVSLLTLGTLSRILRAPLESFEGYRLSEHTLVQAEAMLTSAIGPHLHHRLKSLVFLQQVGGRNG